MPTIVLGFLFGLFSPQTKIKKNGLFNTSSYTLSHRYIHLILFYQSHKK